MSRTSYILLVMDDELTLPDWPCLNLTKTEWVIADHLLYEGPVSPDTFWELTMADSSQYQGSIIATLRHRLGWPIIKTPDGYVIGEALPNVMMCVCQQCGKQFQHWRSIIYKRGYSFCNPRCSQTHRWEERWKRLGIPPPERDNEDRRWWLKLRDRSTKAPTTAS